MTLECIAVSNTVRASYISISIDQETQITCFLKTIQTKSVLFYLVIMAIVMANS